MLLNIGVYAYAIQLIFLISKSTTIPKKNDINDILGCDSRMRLSGEYPSSKGSSFAGKVCVTKWLTQVSVKDGVVPHEYAANATRACASM